MTTPAIPTEEQVLSWFDSLSNWGRWGDDDELGTLNLITDEKRREAASLVTEGTSVTCSRLLVPEMAPDVTSIPPLHYMVSTGESAPSEGGGGASDFLGVSFHGLTVTHLDSLCHQFWNGKMYNGGDALCVRLGWYKRRQEVGPPTAAEGRPGLHAETLPWLRERGVSIAACDASWDVAPSEYPYVGLPIHKVGIVGMGLWLIDAANFDELAPVCRRLNRWEFMFTVAPLRWHNATGSPVNPLATL